MDRVVSAEGRTARLGYVPVRRSTVIATPSHLRGSTLLRSAAVYGTRRIGMKRPPVFSPSSLSRRAALGRGAAVVAREYAIPAVVGAVGATKMIKTGQLITVDGTRGVVVLG